MRRLITTILSGLFVLACIIGASGKVFAAQLQVLSTQVISATPDGTPSTPEGKGSYTAVMSSNGRFVAFSSSSANLGITLPNRETFLYDRQMHTMEMVSVSTSGQPSGYAQPAGVSDDGRYVAFNADSSTLTSPYPTAADGSSLGGVYLRDRAAGTTTLISPLQYGTFAQPHSMSRDGNITVMEAFVHLGTGGDDSNQQESYIYNRTTGVLAPTPNGPQKENLVGYGTATTVSGDGRYVTYGTTGPRLSNGSYGQTTSYLYDLSTGTSTPFETGADDGVELSNDGSHALYYLVTPIIGTNSFSERWDLYIQNLQTGEKQILIPNISNGNFQPNFNSMSFSDDLHLASMQLGNGVLVVMDLNTGQQTSIGPTTPGDAQLTADGTQIAYDGILSQPNSRFQVFVAQLGYPTLAAPTNLMAATPTNTPSLQWDTVTGADQYHIFRDGAQISTATTNSYTDGTAAEGNHTYFVTAVDSTGAQLESAASNTIAVLVDKTPPTVSNLTRTPQIILFQGDMNISADASDALSGVAGGEYYIDTDPGIGQGSTMAYASGKVTATAHISGLSVGRHQLYVRVKDAAGNWSAPISVKFTFV